MNYFGLGDLIGLLKLIPLIPVVLILIGTFHMMAGAIWRHQIENILVFGLAVGAALGLFGGLRAIGKHFVRGFGKQVHVCAFFTLLCAILGPLLGLGLTGLAVVPLPVPFPVWGLAWYACLILVARYAAPIVAARLPAGFAPSFGNAVGNIHGSARWGTAKDAMAKGHLAPVGKIVQSGMMYGRVDKVPKGTDPRFMNAGHALVCAPTGAGKGVGFVIPNLLTYEGSVVCLDLKGENYAVTHRLREQMGQQICLVDPWGVCTGAKQSRINWLADIDPGDPDCISAAGALADMIVIPDGGADAGHWEEAAKDILRGLILWMAHNGGTIADVRGALTLPSAQQEEVWAAMELSEEAHGVIARAASSYLAKPERERGSVLSTVQRHTAFLDDPRIRECVSGSDFSLADLKKQAMTVYVVLPPRVLAQQARFIRGLVGLALQAITGNTLKPTHSVLLMLDEFAQLGRMDAITDALSLIRGYGGTIAVLVQDLGQLRAAYREKANVYLSNCSQIYFGTGDNETAESISKSLGQWTAEYQTTSRQEKMMGAGNGSQSQAFTARSLLTADEVRRLPADRAIAFVRGEPAYLLQRLNYLSDPEYAGRFDGNPYHA
jgi:type IV secretion system protein VirD4